MDDMGDLSVRRTKVSLVGARAQAPDTSAAESNYRSRRGASATDRLARKKHVILFLAANPVGTDRLALDREARAIRAALKSSRHRDRFDFKTRWAAQPLDLLSEVCDLKPTVVHFSGHAGAGTLSSVPESGPGRDVVAAFAPIGAEPHGLYFHDAAGGAQMVSAEAIARVLGAAGKSVRLVVLNACFTEPIAEALLAHVDCVVCMSGAIHDDAARRFAIGFYGALGEYESIATAFEQGKAAINLEALDDADGPRLKVRDGFDPTQLILAATPPPVRLDLRCPYPGMRPYAAEDATGFHGRDPKINELLGRLRANEREIYVIGPSGSGKSSLVAAGVLPRLARGVTGLGPFVVRELQPGEQPAARLRQALEVPAEQPLVAAGRIAAGCIAALLAHRVPSSSLLIVIDQLEELCTQASASECELFLAALRALRTEPRCVVIFTLRDDFLGAFKESPLWTERRGQLPSIEVGPLCGEALRDAIVEPARAVDVEIEAALIERLLADAASEPGVLPLLQETMVQLWDERMDQTLALADYQALGDERRSGLAIALACRADVTLRQFTLAQTAIARRILLRLVSFGEGRSDTRRQQPRTKLRAAADDADFANVLRQMIDDRLLTIKDDHGGDPCVDLAHEVMITAWPTLAGWIQTHRADEQRRRQMEALAAQWVERGRLLDRSELADAEAWQETETARDLGGSDNLKALIAASRSADDKQRRWRRGLLWSVFAALAVIIVVFALQASENRRLLAQSFQEAGWQQLLGGHPQEAIPYLLAARQKGEDGEVLRLLIGTATRFLPLIPILEHRAAVSSAAFSSDGTRIVTASSDNTARVWDAASGKSLAPLLGHQGAVNSAAFSPDGTRVVTASDDNSARIWNAATGRPLTTLEHQGPVRSAAFSPDGTRIVTASDDHTARIWDAASGKLLASPLRHRCVVWSAAFSSDGTRVVTASWDHTARVWDAATGRPLAAALEHQDRVIGAAFSPDGTRVVTVSWDKTARVWDAITGKPVAAPLEHQGPVRSAAFSPDGRRVVTASSDRTARIWDAATGKPLASPFVHPGAVRSAAFSPDGTRVVTASYDKAARVWEVTTGKLVASPLEHQGGVNSAAFSPDGTRVVTASLDSTARVWDAAAGTPFVTSLEHRRGVTSAAFSPDSTRVVTASLDNTARVWDAATGKPLPSSLQHQRAVMRAAFSPDGTRVVTASDDNTARVWDTATGMPLTAPLEHQGAVNHAAFSPDGTRVVTASDDHTARVWDAASGISVAAPLEHQGAVNYAAFSPDGTRVVTASFDNAARIWDAATGEPLAPPLEHQGWVWSAAFSPDGTRVVTASFDNTARIWDTATGKPLASPLEHQGWVWSAAFSADGARVVTASFDNTARVWDAATGKPVATLLDHQRGVNSAAFNPDGTRVVTASDDNTVRVWDAASGKPLAPPLQHQAAVFSAAFSPDGTRIITVSDDNTARVWETRLEKTAPPAWSVLAARSPFVLSGTGHVRRAPEPVLDLAARSTTRPARTPGTSCSRTPRNGVTAKSTPKLSDRRVQPNPFAPRQIWSGHYFCSQGRTALALQITLVRDDTVDAVFAFTHAESGASGSYRVSGRYDPTRGRLALLSGDWIQQPPGYRSVDPSGTVSADGSTFAGSITTSGCSTFTVRRR